jgi:hypothetical protein
MFARNLFVDNTDIACMISASKIISKISVKADVGVKIDTKRVSGVATLMIGELACLQECSVYLKETPAQTSHPFLQSKACHRYLQQPLYGAKFG